MPELPEVETIKRQLSPDIINKKITNTFSSGKRLRRDIPDLSSLKNQIILSVYRRNKYLILSTNHYWIVIHLGMTGKLIVEKSFNLKKHTHYLLTLTEGLYLSYEDARRFGSLDLFKKTDFADYLDIPLFSKLGIEPLSNDFIFSKVNEIMNKSSTDIKKFLMDSNSICGIGNIYANELLFICKINPREKTKNLSLKDKKSLFKEIPVLLNKAISLGGSSISDFVHANGSKGSMQDNYFVYGRENQPCKICNTPIKKIFQGGRSSFYCPQCQGEVINQ